MESRYLYTVMCKGMKVLQRQSLKFSPNVFKNYGAYSTSSEVETPQIKNMRKLLEKKFPLAKSIDIVDISGGCGDMYQVAVESVEFKGLTTVNQHRLITEALKKEIEAMHGITIHTSIPS